MITIPNWMSISSFEELRKAILRDMPLSSLIDIGRGVWGSDFGSCAFVLQSTPSQQLAGRFLRLYDKAGSVAGNEELKQRFFTNARFSKSNAEFEKISGSPIAYWLSKKATDLFISEKSMGERLDACVGLQTCDNDRFLRYWTEVSHYAIGFGAGSIDESVKTGRKWFPCNKGGVFRKWYGNLEHVVNWQNDGQAIREFQVHLNSVKKPTSRMGIANNSNFYFRESASWADITISRISFRFIPQGCIFDVTGNSAFASDTHSLLTHLAYLNTEFVNRLSKVLNPTVHFPAGYFRLLPSASCHPDHFAKTAERAVRLSRADWDAYERSWDFKSLPILTSSFALSPTLHNSYNSWITQNRETISELKGLEEENNLLFIDAYGFEEELTPEVPVEQITLTVNPAYRYGGKLSEEELWTRFRQDTMEELVSFALGCMMGRYSLDKEGLVYAHSGNEGFDPSQYRKFPADEDGIVPVTEAPWFDDDAANRFERFVKTVWPADTLDENLAFVAESLGAKKTETPRETIRRYFGGDFYKHHLQTYKNRPIYWLFSSGKQGAFEALVYLHRYNEGTLSRMRTEYVVPLLGKMNGRIGMLADTIATATSTKQRKDAEKEKDKLTKQLAELQTFDERLNHFASQRITLDLDDGVRVNYGKFGDLLADVKKVCGKAEED